MKNSYRKPGEFFLDRNTATENLNSSGGSWKYFENFEEILNFSNLLNEKGIRERPLKSTVKKLISRKFFYNNNKNTKLDQLNQCYELFLEKNKKNLEEKNINNKDNNIEMKIENNKNNQENENENENEEKKENKNIEANDIEKQNKLLSDIFKNIDIENINHNENNLENILENENNPIPEILMPIDDYVIDNKNNLDSNFTNEIININKVEENNLKPIIEAADIAIDITENTEEGKEDKLNLIKDNLFILEEKVTNYMKNYDKEWESLDIREKWVNI